MTQNQSNDVAAMLNPPLGKKPPLSEKQMKNMRMVLQSVSLSTPVNNTYFYNIVQKQSNWGFSSNQRLLILNSQDKTISYLSKLPQGYLPYTSYEQITANKVKQKLAIPEAQNFKCNPVKGKISTMLMEWVDKDKIEKKWSITVGSSKLMNDWIGLINGVKNGNLDKDKYEQIGKTANNNPLTNNTPVNSNRTYPQLNSGYPTSQNQNISPSIPAYLATKQQENLPNTTLSNPQNPNTSNSQLQKGLSSSNLATSNLISGQSVVKPQQNSFNGEESQFSRKPKILKIGESKTSIYEVPDNNNQGPGNFGSNYTEQPYRGSFNNQQPNFKSYVPTTSQQNISSKPAISGHSLKVQNPNISSSNLRPNDNFTSTAKSNDNMIPNSNVNFNPSVDSRTLQPSQSQPADFVQELKRQRKKNPEKFILNNELSQKKFYQNENSPQSDLQYPGYYESKEINNFGKTPSEMEGSTMGGRVPSQHYLKKQNSGENRLPMMQSQYPYTPQNQQNENETKPFFRTKTNSNFQLQKDISHHILVRQPSGSRMSSQMRIPVTTSSGMNNNQDGEELVDQQDNYEQVYRPNTSFPESTKNLNKIRSDYLRRKVDNSGVIQRYEDENKPYPLTSKNEAHRLMEEERSVNVKKSREPSLSNMSKFDSTQKRRQESMVNLNKVNSNYLSSKQQKSYPSYNDLWLQTSNPNKKLQTYNQFINRSRQLVKQIVEELPFPASSRQFQPVDSYERENLYTFAVENMMIKLHFFNNQQSVNDSQDNINLDAPVLYDHVTYQQIKREFYNYNLILSVTGNQGKIKVPLCCYIEYRGVVALVKADIPSTYRQVEPYSYQEQFQALENMTKVRFLFNTFNCYETQSYRGGEGKFILLWNLKNLIPGIPNTLKNQSSYFRKQFLLQYDQILEDLESSSEAHAFTLRHILPEFLAKLESLQIQILHSKDLTREFHRVGLSLSYLPDMYKQTVSIYLKKVFMSEIVTGIFTEVVRSELNHAFGILPAQNMHNASPEELDSVIVACAHVLINEFFSYTLRSQNIWKLIVNEASKRYRMIVSKEDVIPGYILSGIVHKLGLECDFKQKSLMKQKKFFIHENILPRQVFLTFLPCVRRYDMESICPTYSKCKQLLESEELTVQNYEQLSMILNLKNRATDLPQYYAPILQELKTYLANFIPYTMQQEFQKMDVYEFMYEEPVTHNGIRTAFLAIKWLIKTNQIEKANQVFEIKFHQLSYWLTEYNSAIAGFYDFFSMFYASVGDFEESICLAKSSLINMTKILGPGALPVADKHYQLGNIYFKINKKNEALKQYNKTKQILINHQKTAIPEYGIILLKIALLCLNFGELTECLGNAIEAERIFQNNGGSQNEEIQCFEILARVYQITRKPSDMNNLCEACSKTLNMTENPKVMERMLKIITFPKISQLSSQQQKYLLPILSKLQQHKSPSSHPLYLQSFNFLHKLSLKNFSIKKKLYNYLENVSILSQEINRKDLIRKHSSFNERAVGEAEQMLVLIQAIGNIIGWNFLIGALKEGWYD